MIAVGLSENCELSLLDSNQSQILLKFFEINSLINDVTNCLVRDPDNISVTDVRSLQDRASPLTLLDLGPEFKNEQLRLVSVLDILEYFAFLERKIK